MLRNSELSAWDESVGNTQLWVLNIVNAEEKNGWFAARFVLDSRPPAASRSREDERQCVTCHVAFLNIQRQDPFSTLVPRYILG